MKNRKSFFIRWITIRDDEDKQDEISVIDVEHIQSGDKCRLSSLEEASLWMSEVNAHGSEKGKEQVNN